MTEISLPRRQLAISMFACLCLAACGAKKPSDLDVAAFLKQQVPPYVSLENVATQYTALTEFQGTTMPADSWQIDVTVSTKSSQAFVRGLQASIFALPGRAPTEGLGTSQELQPFMALYVKTIQDGMQHGDAFNAAGASSGLDFKPGHKADNLAGYEAPSIDLPSFVLNVAPAGLVTQSHVKLLATPDDTKPGSWHFELLGLVFQQPWDTQTLDEYRQQNPGAKIMAVGSPDFIAMQTKLQALDAKFAK